QYRDHPGTDPPRGDPRRCVVALAVAEPPPAPDAGPRPERGPQRLRPPEPPPCDRSGLPPPGPGGPGPRPRLPAGPAHAARAPAAALDPPADLDDDQLRDLGRPVARPAQRRPAAGDARLDPLGRPARHRRRGGAVAGALAG